MPWDPHCQRHCCHTCARMHGCDRWSTSTRAPRPPPSIAACLTWCRWAAPALRATLCHTRGQGSWGLCCHCFPPTFLLRAIDGGNNIGGSGSGGSNSSVLLWLDIFAINQNPYAAKGALLSDDVANLAKVGSSLLTSVDCKCNASACSDALQSPC